jgi:hypothetical protein
MRSALTAPPFLAPCHDFEANYVRFGSFADISTRIRECPLYPQTDMFSVEIRPPSKDLCGYGGSRKHA